jgi:hypothetical protein
MKYVGIDASHLSVIGFPRHASGQGRSLIAPSSSTRSREKIRFAETRLGCRPKDRRECFGEPTASPVKKRTHY